MATKARIGVLGAGLMGHGIAQVFALAGHAVTIYDPVAASLSQVRTRIAANLRDLGDDEAAAERVQPCADLAAAVGEADFVVEAAPEDLEIKRKLFRETEALVRRMGQPQRERAAGADAAVDPNIRRLQDDLSEKLGATVAIEHSETGKGRLVVRYNSLDELDGILGHIV